MLCWLCHLCMSLILVSSKTESQTAEPLLGVTVEGGCAMERLLHRSVQKRTKDLRFTVTYGKFADTFADIHPSVTEERRFDLQQSMWFFRHWVWAIYRWDSVNQELLLRIQMKTKCTRRTTWTARSWRYSALIEPTDVSIDLDDETAQLGEYDCFGAQKCQLTVWEA